MISNQHQNKVPSSSTKMSKNKPTAHENGKLPEAQEGTISSISGVKNVVTPEKSAKNSTSTHHRRSRTYACSTVDEVAKAFELDVQNGKLVEKSRK
jgi:hypothetical protein